MTSTASTSLPGSDLYTMHTRQNIYVIYGPNNHFMVAFTNKAKALKTLEELHTRGPRYAVDGALIIN